MCLTVFHCISPYFPETRFFAKNSLCVGLTTNTFDIRLKCEALLILLYSRSSMIIWPGAVGSNKTICSNNSGDSDPGQNPTQNQERETTNTCGSSVHTAC